MRNNMVFNTGETQEELRQRYNPDGSKLRKAQLRMLDMLIYLDKVCKEQGIKYFLGGGNVLGAVRHGGFIPWDDDIDLVMDYSEYKKLVNYLIENPHPQYKIQCKETDKGFFGAWAVLRDTKSEYHQDSKIHNLRCFRGLQVDLFPFDKGNIFLLRCLIRIVHEKIIVSCLEHNKYRIASISWNICYKILVPLCRCLNVFGDKNKYSHTYGAGWLKEVFDIHMIEPYGKILFEGHEFPCPHNVNDFLRNTYGNYMDLPKPENRNKHMADYSIWD